MKPYAFVPMDAPNWDDLAEDEWTRVEGGPLPAPIYIRVVLAADGKPVITGMILGGSWPRGEISANHLRDVKPREILNALFANYDPNEPPDYNDWEESITWGLMHEVFMMRIPFLPVDSEAARGGATTDRLAQFADVYRRQLTLNPQRAMTATAKEMNMSRATANRWAERARGKGLLAARRSAGVEMRD